MNQFHVFIIRAILGLAFSALMTRMFFGHTNPIFILGLAIFLVGTAYLTEYFRNRKKKSQ